MSNFILIFLLSFSPSLLEVVQHRAVDKAWVTIKKANCGDHRAEGVTRGHSESQVKFSDSGSPRAINRGGSGDKWRWFSCN